MRSRPILPAVALCLWACGDAPPPTGDGDGLSPEDGILIVTTRTTGGEPDPDGFQLVVDDTNSVLLELADSAQIAVAPGRHTLRLLGAAGHCAVTPTSADVQVETRGAARVAFEISCPGSFIRVTTATGGIDRDQDGYRLSVNRVDWHDLPGNGTVVIRVQPGTHTLVASALADNCAVEGSDSSTITVADPDTVPVGLSVTCRAVTGVIGVTVDASGRNTQGGYLAKLQTYDGELTELIASLAEPAFSNPVPSGNLAVTLDAPPNCTVNDSPQSVAVPGGGLVRDTVMVNFTVTCRKAEPNVRITAPTSGRVPSSHYHVMHESYGYWDYGGAVVSLGPLAPNDTLMALVPNDVLNYWHWFWLKDVPDECSVRSPHPNPSSGFAIPENGVLKVEFEVSCPP